MPPKGWRKDAQGNYPVQSFIKEQEKLTIDDLLFPKNSILNLAKEVQMQTDPNRRLVITKDASLALQRSATVFVSHLLVFAREIAKEQNRKSCNVDDILMALDQIGHPGLKNMVSSKLDEYQRIMNERKQLKAKQNSTTSRLKGENGNDTEVEEDENSNEGNESNNNNKRQRMVTTDDPETSVSHK